MYKRLEDQQGTYDVAHFRRTDISRKNYVGGHSMVSKKSYHDAFAKFEQIHTKLYGFLMKQILDGSGQGKIPSISGKKIAWLHDFLKVMFARKIFRSNSSFSFGQDG